MMKLSLGVDPDVQTEFVDMADQAEEEEEEEEEEEVAVDGDGEDGEEVEEPTEDTVTEQEEVRWERALFTHSIAILGLCIYRCSILGSHYSLPGSFEYNHF